MPATTAKEEVIMEVLMKDIKVDSENATKFTRKMIELSHEEKEEKVERVKKPYLTIVSDPRFHISRTDEFVSWVVQKCPVEDCTSEYVGKEIPDEDFVRYFRDCMARFNETKKGKKNPLLMPADVFDGKDAKSFFKKNGISICTQEPVFVCLTNNHPMGEAILPGTEFGNLIGE